MSIEIKNLSIKVTLVTSEKVHESRPLQETKDKLTEEIRFLCKKIIRQEIETRNNR
jgi:hypothetical protein